MITIQKIKNQTIDPFLLVLASLSFAFTLLGGSHVGAETQQYVGLINTCKPLLPKSIRNQACVDANLQPAVDAAIKVCEAETGTTHTIWGSACVLEYAESYVKKASKPSPTSVNVFKTKVVKVSGDAVNSAPKAPKDCSIGSGKCDLVAKYLNPLINMLAGLIGLAAVISLIVGGIQYTASAGDPQKVSKAKNRIGMTIVALLGFFSLYGFLQFLIPGGIF